MSREIKFRVWNNKNKEWDYETVSRICGAVYFDDTSDLNLPSSSLDDSFPKIFCQFTGLKDKNGKEIYEGDIAKIAAFPNDEIIIGEIKYFPDVMWFGFEFDEQEHLNFLDINSTKGIEIIGNIWENPEILKEPTP